jgi:hypothetical protein
MKIQFLPHKKHYISATNTNPFMLFRETNAVYCENHTKHINTRTFYEQNSQFQYAKAGSTYSNHWALKD